MLPKGLGVRIDLSALGVLPVFKWLAREGGVADLEMLRTFNCGIGMVAVVSADRADDVVASLVQSGETAAVLGEVAAIEGEQRVAYRGVLDLRL